MSGFDQVIKLTEEGPLVRSLPAALRLATVLGDGDWADWLRLELMGYWHDNPSLKESTIVPAYRSVPGEWYDEYGRPLVLHDPKLLFINETRLRYGVAELESLVSRAPGSIRVRLPGEAKIIRDNLEVDVAIFQFHHGSVEQVLTNIRINSLDHLVRRKPALTAKAEAAIEKQDDILLLKPSLWGVGIDLRALWKRMRSGRK